MQHYEMSAGCEFAVELPTAPKPPKRPGAFWQFVTPDFPKLYE